MNDVSLEGVMNKFFIAICFLMLFLDKSFSSEERTVWVNNYTKSNQTYFNGYWRSSMHTNPSGASLYYGGHSGEKNAEYLGIIRYKYTIQIWLDNKSFDGSSFEEGSNVCSSSTYMRTAKKASEISIIECGDNLHKHLHNYELDYNNAGAFVSGIFNRDNCTTSGLILRSKTFYYSYYEEIMQCIVQ